MTEVIYRAVAGKRERNHQSSARSETTTGTTGSTGIGTVAEPVVTCSTSKTKSSPSWRGRSVRSAPRLTRRPFSRKRAAPRVRPRRCASAVKCAVTALSTPSHTTNASASGAVCPSESAAA